MQQLPVHGKTAVLVERIIRKIIDDGLDIDKLLVVTFTNAAASEMKERILGAIYKALDENPNDHHLENQINLLNKASISTIHSFCLDVIRNNFFEIDISSNFRIAADEEIEILKGDIIDDLFEEKYESNDEKFMDLVETYCGYRDDEKLKDIVLKLYEFSRNDPFPDEWLDEKVEMFNCKCETGKDFKDTVWGETLLKDLENEILDAINSLKVLQDELLKKDNNCKVAVSTLQGDIDLLENLKSKLDVSWDCGYKFYKESYVWEKWKTDKELDKSLKDDIRDKRSNIRDHISKKLSQTLLYESKDAFLDLYEMYDLLLNLKKIVKEFSIKYRDEKKDQNIIDFSDIEHFALDILVKRAEDGTLHKTDTAKRIESKYEEIAIDEYQDSNRVQETILKSISNGKNMFMVGDVKQSIYKFRRACPELFLEKYESYDEDGNDKGLKIKLYKNFRSRKCILDLVNDIFESIMSKDLGDINYDENEFLNLGAEYVDDENFVDSEVYVIDDKKSNLNDSKHDLDEELDGLLKEEKESRFIAEKIKELIDEKYLVTDKGVRREIKYKDIVLLMRSTKQVDIYERELLKKGIPVFTDGGENYLETIEITTVMNLLKVIDNPLDDISLVAVLRSKMFSFTDNEIITIRLFDKTKTFYDDIKIAINDLEDLGLKEKLIDFKSKLDMWRKKSKYMALSELIWEIYMETNFYNYVLLMPNGSVRQANLKMLFLRAQDYEKTNFKGLFNFIKYVEKLKLGSSDLSSAKVIGENENVVRIMSIHKSKGLEFPVVILCNASKRINFEDLKGDMLLHQDIGLGPEYINFKRKIKFPTAAKQAIKIKLKDETISEEMRVLYVALTRAKEKLIITAVRGNEEKSFSKKREEVKEYINGKKLDSVLVKKYISYLDWIELTYLRNMYIYGSNNSFKLELVKQDELSKNDKCDAELDRNDDLLINYDDYSDIEEKLNWKYDDKKLKLPIKTTASNFNYNESDVKNSLNVIQPKFIKESYLSPVEIGTIYHLVLQKIDYSLTNSISDIKCQIDKLVSMNLLKSDEAETIDVNKIWKFLNSYIGEKLKTSQKIYREKPFYMKINASKLDENLKDEEVLVQGIIDLYFEDENGDIILVDYKTDQINEGEESVLIDRYFPQLELYKEAIKEATGKDVSEAYIYSLSLNKEIKM